MTRTATITATVLVFALALSTASTAQRVSLAPWVGVSLSEIAGGDAESFGFEGGRTGFAAGGFLSIRLHQLFSILPGAYYSQQGVKIPFSEETLELDYLQFPLLLSLDIASSANVAPSLFVGPQFGVQVRCRYVNGGRVDCPDGEITTSDLSVLGGARLAFRLGRTRLFLIAAYGLGLASIDATASHLDVRNRAMVIGLGWGFPLRW